MLMFLGIHKWKIVCSVKFGYSVNSNVMLCVTWDEKELSSDV
jgi:hypothetical protein